MIIREAFLRSLADIKGLPPEKVTDWGSRDGISFACLIMMRLLRGAIVKFRMGYADGWVLCEKQVRLYHPWHIRAGRRFNLEEGCEIVGLSKKGIVFGHRCTVGRFAVIRPTNVLLDEPGEGLRMGDYSNIGPFSYIGCSGFVEIGTRVMMGPRVNLLAENHNYKNVNVPMQMQGITRGPIIIGDDCWLGANSTILSNVMIGRGSIVAAGAVVTKDVPEYVVVGGVPAQVIRQRQSKAG